MILRREDKRAGGEGGGVNHDDELHPHESSACHAMCLGHIFTRHITRQIICLLLGWQSHASITMSDDESPCLIFNILGRIYSIERRVFHTNPNLFHGTLLAEADQLEQFYDRQRQQYVIDISPCIFESIVQYYRTEELIRPINVQRDYYEKILAQFQIDSSSLDIDKRYERVVPRQATLQLIHVVAEYADCRSTINGGHALNTLPGHRIVL